MRTIVIRREREERGKVVIGGFVWGVFCGGREELVLETWRDAAEKSPRQKSCRMHVGLCPQSWLLVNPKPNRRKDTGRYCLSWNNEGMKILGESLQKIAGVLPQTKTASLNFWK